MPTSSSFGSSAGPRLGDDLLQHRRRDLAAAAAAVGERGEAQAACAIGCVHGERFVEGSSGHSSRRRRRRRRSPARSARRFRVGREARGARAAAMPRASSAKTRVARRCARDERREVARVADVEVARIVARPACRRCPRSRLARTAVPAVTASTTTLAPPSMRDGTTSRCARLIAWRVHACGRGPSHCTRGSLAASVARGVGRAPGSSAAPMIDSVAGTSARQHAPGGEQRARILLLAQMRDQHAMQAVARLARPGRRARAPTGCTTTALSRDRRRAGARAHRPAARSARSAIRERRERVGVAGREVAIQIGAGQRDDERAIADARAPRARSPRGCGARAARSSRPRRRAATVGTGASAACRIDPVARRRAGAPSAPRCASCRCWRRRDTGVTRSSDGRVWRRVIGRTTARSAPRSAAALAARCAKRASIRSRMYAHLTRGAAAVSALRDGQSRRAGSSATSAGSRSSGAGATAATTRAARARRRACRNADALVRLGARRRTTRAGTCRCRIGPASTPTSRPRSTTRCARSTRSRDGERYFFELALVSRGHARRGAADDAADARACRRRPA